MNTGMGTSGNAKHRFIVFRGGKRDVSPILLNLLRDTSPSILTYLSEQYGLRRVPGLSKTAMIDRILYSLSDEALRHLENSLIAARYGVMSIEELLKVALKTDMQHQPRAGTPRLDDMPPEDAVLLESDGNRWAYTMHGYDVVIDLKQRQLACDCPYFRFASRRRALCKHVARALTMIPAAYAREVLIDLLVSREYGGPYSPRWRFDYRSAA